MKGLVHERSQERMCSWSHHNTEGWYIRPAMNYYRQHRVWVPSIGAERIADTVTWLPHNIDMPTSSSNPPMVLNMHFAKSPMLPPVNTQTRTALMKVQHIFTDRFAAPLQPLPSSHLPTTTRTTKSSMPADLSTKVPSKKVNSNITSSTKLLRVPPSSPTA